MMETQVWYLDSTLRFLALFLFGSIGAGPAEWRGGGRRQVVWGELRRCAVSAHTEP